MNIARSISLHGNINTELFDIVNNIPPNILFNNEHQSRPPLGIYNVSTSRVINAFEKISKLMGTTNSDNDELEKAHKELLDSLMAFIDDGYHIMKTIFPKSAVQGNIIFADKWVKAVDIQTKSIVNDYKRIISPYRFRLALMDNKIKHNHARHCHVQVSTICGKIKGYYIEGVTSNGAITPNTEIHPLTNKGEYTATSYNWDVKNFFVDFYIISMLISRTIYKLISHYHGITIPTGKIVNQTYDDDLFRIHEIISNIPSLFFPQEYDNDIPQIIVKRSEGSIELRKKAYKSYIKKLRRYSSCNVTTTLSADGVSSRWALPYLQ
ncbi:hypothetical protein [Peribacillus butanolivorans]|uniref:hypothetical protein n=1 Tax=Peribacillus butanolivorans TaxID=421767 RepID=UPI00364E8AF0